MKAYHIQHGPLFESIEHLVEFYAVYEDGLPTRLTCGISPGISFRYSNIHCCTCICTWLCRFSLPLQTAAWSPCFSLKHWRIHTLNRPWLQKFSVSIYILSTGNIFVLWNLCIFFHYSGRQRRVHVFVWIPRIESVQQKFVRPQSDVIEASFSGPHSRFESHQSE